jgi:glutamate synthase (NADPH/NADH) large chain
MSGGIAFVYDVKGIFSLQCNKEMVDLDPVEEADKTELFRIISDHFKYTNSAVAKFVLEDFENQLKNFIKVFPKDYKKVLLKQSGALKEELKK